MILMFRFMRRFTAFGLAFLVTFGVWCGGFAGDASVMLVKIGSDSAPGCMHDEMPTQAEGQKDSGFPCVFRSLDFLSQGSSLSVEAQKQLNFGNFIPAVSLSSSERFGLTTHFRAGAQDLAAKISPHLFYSVLNL